MICFGGRGILLILDFDNDVSFNNFSEGLMWFGICSPNNFGGTAIDLFDLVLAGVINPLALAGVANPFTANAVTGVSGTSILLKVGIRVGMHIS